LGDLSIDGGGLIAASFLFIVKRTITYKKDMISAASRMVPILVAIMAWAFGTYLMLKGLKKIWKVDFLDAVLIGLAIAIAVYFIVKPFLHVLQIATPMKRVASTGYLLCLLSSLLLCSALHMVPMTWPMRWAHWQPSMM
jgi:hypothetical protein